MLNDNLSETFGKVTWKYKIDELFNELLDSLNSLINRNDLSIKTTELSNELFETLKTLRNCTNCNEDDTGKYNLYEFRKSINVIKKCLTKLTGRKKDVIDKLNNELFKADNKLNKILCEGSKEEKIEKLTDKCGNKEMARFLYQYRLNAKHYDDYIRWISFDKFRNIKYLAKGGFGEVHEATLFNDYYEEKDVVLKRIYNSSNKIVDILKEVK